MFCSLFSAYYCYRYYAHYILASKRRRSVPRYILQKVLPAAGQNWLRRVYRRRAHIYRKLCSSKVSTLCLFCISKSGSSALRSHALQYFQNSRYFIIQSFTNCSSPAVTGLQRPGQNFWDNGRQAGKRACCMCKRARLMLLLLLSCSPVCVLLLFLLLSSSMQNVQAHTTDTHSGSFMCSFVNID